MINYFLLYYHFINNEAAVWLFFFFLRRILSLCLEPFVYNDLLCQSLLRSAEPLQRGSTWQLQQFSSPHMIVTSTRCCFPQHTFPQHGLLPSGPHLGICSVANFAFLSPFYCAAPERLVRGCTARVFYRGTFSLNSPQIF